MANYETPYGSVVVGIDARTFQRKKEAEKIRFHVDYALEINYEHMADCQIVMDIKDVRTS